MASVLSRRWGRPSQPTLAVLPLLSIVFGESVATLTVYPFIVELILSFDVPEQKVGYYLGVLESVSNITSAIVVLQWGRMGDRYGRKPVLLLNTCGLAIAILSFGLSRTFAVLVFSKVLEGLCKASKPTIKSAVAESSDEQRMAFVFSLLPLMHAGGLIVGPFIGGTFADPARRFPRYFGASIWREYPYLLPTSISSMVMLCSFFLTLALFKETLPPFRDSPKLSAHTADASSPLLGHAEDQNPIPIAPPEAFTPTQKRAFSIVLANYALYTVLAMSYNPVLVLFLSSPVAAGGLALPPRTVGSVLSLAGALHAMMQACFFTRAHARWGPKRIFGVAAACFVPIFGAVPVMGALARRAGRVTALVWAVLAVQQAACAMVGPGFTCMYIFIARSAPLPTMLGRTNGLAQMVHSAFSAIGPAVFTSLTAVSIQHNLLGGSLAQLVQALLGFLAFGLAFLLP
ncbi:hypothetical protein HWV62_26336 [Athelia sp. TMB]|nr:hypothetical protein HWV62_26336 [Athelia sp. TMB]